SPNEIIGKISEILYQDKCITLHFIDIVGKLEDNLQQALNRYNTPFEKAVYAQFLTSDFTHNEISTFINETLLSDILDSHVLLTDENILITTKKCKFKDIIEDNIDVNKIGELLEIMKGKVKDRIITLLTNKDFINDLGTILGNNYINSIKELNKSLKELIEKYVDADEKTVNRIQKELVLLIVLYDNYLKDNAAFKESFLYESYRFTKLMKFTKDNDTKIRTGSIYKMKDSNNYIICITPFCDTHNPEKVNGIFKFIVGQPTEAKKVCEKQSDNSFIMALPLDSEKKVGFIDWKLYNTISMNEAELNEQYIKVASLRKEYVQKIINLYLSYQSRAGVNELFYKESSFSGYLINVVS
ncbi:MAG TPA: hypothetical protein VEF53_19325, partial [Patescibacteria group bacterium]|nr:hypothetical protein [Patescibacteria group bacterium]